jgi:hypothetical protein
MAGSKGYNSRAAVSAAPGAFYVIYASDFGATVPALVTLVSGTTAAASLSTTGDVFVKTTWITAEGESVASNEVSIAINTTTTTHYVAVQQPIVPTNGQTVIGWRIYTSYTTNTELLNTTLDTTNFTTTNGGVLAGIALSSNTSAQVQVLAIGAGAAFPAFDQSGVQAPLVSIGANTGVEYYAVVPNSGSQWKQQKSVDFMKSDGTVETLGVTLNHLDFIQPVYPGASGQPAGGSNPPSATYTQASVAPGTYMVMNGYLFVATQTGSQNTATTFIGFSAFNTTKGKTTTDGSVTWLCLGKAGLVRFQFGNVSGSPVTPTAMTYELFQH